MPAKYKDVLSLEDRYRMQCKYPFYIIDNLNKNHKLKPDSPYDTDYKINIGDYLTIINEETFDKNDKFRAKIVVKDENGQSQFLF